MSELMTAITVGRHGEGVNNAALARSTWACVVDLVPLS